MFLCCGRCVLRINSQKWDCCVRGLMHCSFVKILSIPLHRNCLIFYFQKYMWLFLHSLLFQCLLHNQMIWLDELQKLEAEVEVLYIFKLLNFCQPRWVRNTSQCLNGISLTSEVEFLSLFLRKKITLNQLYWHVNYM